MPGPGLSQNGPARIEIVVEDQDPKMPEKISIFLAAHSLSYRMGNLGERETEHLTIPENSRLYFSQRCFPLLHPITS